MGGSPFDTSVFTQWAADYLSWMQQCGYAAQTIYLHKRLLLHFERFAKERNIGRQDLLTHDTLKLFESHCGLSHAAWPLRALSRYLARTGVISAAITKPRLRLDDIYEAHLRFLEKDRQLDLSTLYASRRILSALCDYLAAQDIALRALRIEHIDDFLARYHEEPGSGTGGREPGSGQDK